MKIPPELLTVAKHLGRLTDETVFVGGMIRGLLITDPAAGAARPTDDVDLIMKVASYKAFIDLGKTLRDLGFSESTEEGAPLCRWVVAGVRADVIPIDPSILGFTNVWYADAMEHASVVAGPDGNIYILDAPHFCATKLEAFKARGEGDYVHRDIEDFIAVVDGRPTLLDELAVAPKHLRDFVAEVVASLLATESFMDVLPGHLEGDAGSQARLPLLVEQLRRIAALRETPTPKAPPTPSAPPIPRAQPTIPPPPPRASMPAPGMPFSLPSGPISLQSSNLRTVKYEEATQALTVEFHSGGIYVYSGVPATIFQGLLRAYSAGRYHHQWIRDRYRFDRLS